MARKKPKKIHHAPMAPHIEERFKKLMAVRPAAPALFCGFKLKPENVNPLWRWDTLEEAN